MAVWLKNHQNADGELNVSDNPIIPFIEGDGSASTSGPRPRSSSTPPQEYGKTIEWKEVLADRRRSTRPASGYRADRHRLPRVLIASRVHCHTDRRGLRSLNVALRQILDLRLSATGALVPRRALAREAT